MARRHESDVRTRISKKHRYSLTLAPKWEVREFHSALVSLLKLAAVEGSVLPIGAIVAIGWLPENEQLNQWERRSGWLYCDGRALSRDPPYRALFKALNYGFGSGANPDDFNQTIGDFNIPDFRGRFLRGVDDSGKGRDPDAAQRSVMSPGGNAVGVGSIQADEIESHDHAAQLRDNPFSSVARAAAELKNGLTQGPSFGDNGAAGISRNASSVGVTVLAKGGRETRPVNAAVFWIIKYRDVPSADMEALNAELDQE